MFEPRWASRAQQPPPTKIRKLTEQNIAKSVRASLTMYQNPWFGRNNSGIFVVAMAVQITQEQLKPYVGEMVEAKGKVFERNGGHTIEIKEIHKIPPSSTDK